jgi:hypothetical protein
MAPSFRGTRRSDAVIAPEDVADCNVLAVTPLLALRRDTRRELIWNTKDPRTAGVFCRKLLENVSATDLLFKLVSNFGDEIDGDSKFKRIGSFRETSICDSYIVTNNANTIRSRI